MPHASFRLACPEPVEGLPASPFFAQDIYDTTKKCGEYYQCGNKPYGKYNQHAQFQD
jgi:hypothetical protein